MTPPSEPMERTPPVPCQSADCVGTLARQVLAADTSGTILASHLPGRLSAQRGRRADRGWRPGTSPCTAGASGWPGPCRVPRWVRPYRVAGARLLLGSAVPSIRLSQARVVGTGASVMAASPPRDHPEAPSWQRLGTPVAACPPRGASGPSCPHSPPMPTEVPFRVGRRTNPGPCARLAVGVWDRASVPRAGRGCTPGPGGGTRRPGRGPDARPAMTSSEESCFALAMLRDAGVRPRATRPVRRRRSWSSPRRRTNRISFALLSDHAAGHACEPAHRLVLALMGRESPETTYRAASDLIRVGHSTGWDLLTGAWTAWALVPTG